jgi:hypothetical protein
MPLSSLAFPVKANADICRDNGWIPHLGHEGVLDVLIVLEKKFNRVLQLLQ